LARVRATIDLYSLALAIALLGVKYVTARDLSAMLGVSTRSAGRIIARMERMGLVRRYSRRAYVLEHGALGARVSRGAPPPPRKP
jgi:Mn-dependent DtxR family transcriptional regulator